MAIETMKKLSAAPYIYVLLTRYQAQLKEAENLKDELLMQQRELLKGQSEGFREAPANIESYVVETNTAIQLCRELLEEQKAYMAEFDAFLQRVEDPEMKQILVHRIVEMRKWQDVAILMGGKENSGTIKRRFERYIDKLLQK